MKRRAKVQLSWRDAPGAPPESAPDSLRVLALAMSWPRDLAGERPEAPVDGPLTLDDVLLHVRELDARGDGDGVHDPLATFRLTIAVDEGGGVGVLEAEDVSTSEELPAAWRVTPAPGPRPGVRARLQVHLPGATGAPLEGPTLRVEVTGPDAEEVLLAKARTGSEGGSYEVDACLRRPSQPSEEDDLARAARMTVPLAMDDPVLTPFAVAAIQLEYGALWRLGVNAGNGGVTDVCHARQAAVDAVRALDPTWEPPAPFRGPERVTTAEIIGDWMRGTGYGRAWKVQYCGVTAGRIYLGVGVQPHWVVQAREGEGFLSTLRIRQVMGYRDRVSTTCGVPVRQVGGVTTPCAAGERVEDVLSVEEFHRRSGARRLLLDIGNGRDTSAPPGRTGTGEVDPAKVAAREALFFEQDGLRARVRPGDVVVVGNDWENASRYGKHVTILEGACRDGGCALCARDGLEPGSGPFLHLLEGNPALTRRGSYQIWDPALERELDLESGKVRDARGQVEAGVDVRTDAGRRELAARRLIELGVAQDSPAWGRIQGALALAVARARTTTHLARRRRPLLIVERAARDSAVIYAARFSPLDFQHVPLVELSARGKLIDRPRPEAELPGWVADLGARWAAAHDAHQALIQGGARRSMTEEAWRGRVEALRRTDTPERALARVEAGLSRVARPDLLQWSLGAPDLGGMGCADLPFALAVWARQMSALDEQLLVGRSVTVTGLQTQPVVISLGLRPADERAEADRWPGASPRVGDVVVFGGAAADDVRHVAVATGEGDAVLSLEPAGEGQASPLLRTTIAAYVERARAQDGPEAELLVYYARWTF